MAPRSPKTSKNDTKIIQNDTSNPNFQKTGNLKKTFVFTVFSPHPASQRTSHFLTKPLRKQVPDPDSYFHVQNNKIVTNPKVTKNPSLDPKVSQEVSLWLPRSPKRMPRTPKWRSRAPKWSLQGLKITFFYIKIDAFQKSTNQQSPVLQVCC